jgi:hypothetical protein
MRLLVVLALAAGFVVPASYEARAEIVYGNMEKSATQMSEKEYSKQEREMEKQKQELLKRKADEHAKTQAGKKPENTYGGKTAGGPPPAGGPGGPGTVAPGGPSNQQTKQQAEDEKEDENKTVIKRDEPEDEHKSTNSTQHVNLGQPTKKGCSPGSFGVCSH